MAEPIMIKHIEELPLENLRFNKNASILVHPLKSYGAIDRQKYII